MILRIALQSIHELFHKKTFIVGVLGVLATISMAQLFIYLSPGDEQAFLTDFTYNAAKFICSIFIIYFSSDLFLKDREQNTQYFYFVNPVQDFYLVFGRFLGMIGFIFVYLLIVYFILQLFIFVFMSVSDLQIFYLFWTLFVQSVLLSSFGVLGACLFSKGTNALFILTVQLLSHFSETIHHMFIDHVEASWAQVSADIIKRIIPDFQSFDVLTMVVIKYPIPLAQLSKYTGYCFAYSLVLLAISFLSFRWFFRWSERVK